MIVYGGYIPHASYKRDEGDYIYCTVPGMTEYLKKDWSE